MVQRAILLLLVTATAARAEPLSFGRSSVSYSTQPLQIRIENVRTNNMGWRKCPVAFTTRTPALTWNVAERMEMRISLEDGNGAPSPSSGVIVLPDRTYVCANDKKSFWLRNWPVGTYKLFLTSPNSAARAVVHFDNPNLEKQQLTTAIASLPEIALGSAAHNPQFNSVPATFAVDAANAGSTCAKAGQRVMALARLKIERASRWFIDLDGPEHGQLFVLTSDGHCIDPRSARDIPAGNHTLWSVVDDTAIPPSFPLEIDDRGSPLAFGDAPRKAAGALDYPLVVDGKLRAGQRWFARAGACGGAAREPDFYLTTDKPLGKVMLSLLWSRAHPKLHIYGPIERAQPTAEPSCNTSDHVIDTLDGTYAVWVAGDAPNAPFHVLVRRDGTQIDPMTTLVDPPRDLELADRALKNHYPYFAARTLDDWTKLFTTAPDQLFVYTRNDIDLGDQKLSAGEPLLVASSKGDVTNAYRDDGIQVHLDTRFLTTQKPPTVSLPTIARSPKLDDIAAALAAAGSEDVKAIAEYHALESRKDARLDAAKAKLLKDLDTTRRRRYKLHLIAVRKRFGLSNT